MTESLKSKILKLRNEGKTYDDIRKKLGCSKATISYHCKRHGVSNYDGTKLTNAVKEELNEYYKTHTILETSVKFNVSYSTVVRYTDNKHIKLSDEQLKINNYEKIKSFRQKLKERAIEYKGGKCVRCGYNKCSRAMDFHHLNPKEKDFGFSSYTVLKWEKVKIELDKCILVCSNCHSEIHDEVENNIVLWSIG